MPSVWETVKPTPVPRCPKRHPIHHAGCEGCRDWGRYQRRLETWERAHGISRSFVPVGPTLEHLMFLTGEGNRTIESIAAESGVSSKAIQKIMAGKRSKLLPITEQSLAAIKPLPAHTPPFRNLVPNTEGVRLLRGLFAQGWTDRHIGDLLGGLGRGAARFIAVDQRSHYMERETLDRVRAVARDLGGYDIDELPRRLPGMDPRSARSAAEKGWHKLRAWEGLDIADPAADPATAKADQLAALTAVDDQDEAGADLMLGYVDPLFVKTVKETAERVRIGSRTADGRTGDLYLPKLDGLRQLEMHVAWWYAEEGGLNDSQIGVMFGYAPGDEAGGRHINRVRARVLEARAWFERHPHGWVPRWFAWKPSKIGGIAFDVVLPALIALQPAPFGPGWSIPQLADICGVPEEDMVGFLVYASRMGDRLWKPQGHARRPRTNPARCEQSALAPAA